jgi:hypothetical protein
LQNFLPAGKKELRRYPLNGISATASVAKGQKVWRKTVKTEKAEKILQGRTDADCILPDSSKKETARFYEKFKTIH